MNTPYPGIDPNIGPLPIMGDLHRTCFVIEFRGLEHMSETQKIAIREKLEAYSNKILSENFTLENYKVACDSQFSPTLSASLHLKR